MTTGFGGALRAGRFVVRVVDGPDRGRFLPLGEDTVVVGAGAHADLPLHDPGVSRRHLEIALVDSGVRVVDLGSKNGTLLLGARLKAALVGVGAELVLGKTTLRIDDADAFDDVMEADALGPLKTRSTAMRRCLGALSRIAATEIPVLLQGEADVGHASVARALHAASTRAQGPFCEVALGALKRDEIGAALFGRGAEPGAFERAHNGTLLVEDLERMPAPLQAPLVHAIETGAVARPGDPRPRRVSVRVVAATHADVDTEVRAGRILPELRDAVAAVRVIVPPLRERAPDLAELCRGILDELGSAAPLDEGTLARLRAYRWPGNLAEVKLVLARAVAQSPPGELHVSFDPAGASAESLRDERDRFERDKLVEILRAHDGNVSAAARAAGIDRRHLHRLLKKHGLRGG